MSLNGIVRTPPHDAPRCWGRSFQPNDRECNSCSYQYSCKEAFSSTNGIPMVPTAMPGVPTIPQVPQFPSNPYTMPSNVPAPPVQWRTVQPAQPTSQVPQYQHQQAAAYPGIPPYFYPAYASGPYDYMAVIGQQPGEGTGERIVKNVILRALEAMLTEALRFLHFFSWPKSSPGGT